LSIHFLKAEYYTDNIRFIDLLNSPDKIVIVAFEVKKVNYTHVAINSFKNMENLLD